MCTIYILYITEIESLTVCLLHLSFVLISIFVFFIIDVYICVKSFLKHFTDIYNLYYDISNHILLI